MGDLSHKNCGRRRPNDVMAAASALRRLIATERDRVSLDRRPMGPVVKRRRAAWYACRNSGDHGWQAIVLDRGARFPEPDRAR